MIWSKLKPFEGAQNRTSIITMKKGKETTYPLPYVIWRKKARKGIDQEASLEEVMKLTLRLELVAAPITSNTRSPWVTAKPESIVALKKVVKR